MSWLQLYGMGALLYGIFATWVVCQITPRGPMPMSVSIVHTIAGLVTIGLGALLWPYFLLSNIYHTVFDK